nr:hormone receptor 4-like [Cavia porcellus]
MSKLLPLKVTSNLREGERERDRERERERERERLRRRAKGRSQIWPKPAERKLDALATICQGLAREPKRSLCMLLQPLWDWILSLLAEAPRFLSYWIWGATLPGAGRSNEPVQKHKMNRLSIQSKTGGSSTPARRHLLLPSLEAL